MYKIGTLDSPDAFVCLGHSFHPATQKSKGKARLVSHMIPQRLLRDEQSSTMPLLERVSHYETSVLVPLVTEAPLELSNDDAGSSAKAKRSRVEKN